MQELDADKCKSAVEWANQFGIYAIPCRHCKTIYWKPRLPDGKDPNLGWLLKTQPTPSGWLSWDDAVNALGDRLYMACGLCYDCQYGRLDSCAFLER